MKTRLILAYIFNLADMAITLYLNGKGGFMEANPFVAIILRYPILFIIAKVFLMAWMFLIIWKDRRCKLAEGASWFAFLYYGIIVLYYIILFIYITEVL